MEAADQTRILQILANAQGDPARLALANVDLTFADRPAEEIDRLRTALLAAAVPHWFDPAFLSALLETSQPEADALMSQLRKLSNVETFHARGPDACNVHEASRLALREFLRTTQPDLWQHYAQRARDHMAGRTETHERVEALYHQFAADSAAAVTDCAALDRELRQDPAKRWVLCAALLELTAAGWLQGAALVEAKRSPLWYRRRRGEASQLEQEAQELLTLAREYSHPSRVADAQQLTSYIYQAHGQLESARAILVESLRICRDMTAQEPGNLERQRELSLSLNELGNLAVAQGDLAVALQSFTESKLIAERLAVSDPANAVWQLDLSVSLSKLGDLAVTQGDLTGAWSLFTESKVIAELLAASDPANADWQREHTVLLDRLGDLAVAQGDLTGAWRLFTESQVIRERLASSDPANAAWQRDLSLSYYVIARKICVPEERWSEALLLMEKSLSITERLAATDRSNVQWQKDEQTDRRLVTKLREQVQQSNQPGQE